MEERKVLFLPLLLLGLSMDLISGTMGAPDNPIQQMSTVDGAAELINNGISQTSHQPPPHSSPSVSESASLSLPGEGGDPLVCWSCSSSSHGNPCYNIDPENSSAVDGKNCAPEETFCSVVHIWYVVETTGKKENVNFSVNRTCATECNPNCMVIGDRTKIHSCTSCCTESYCNTESSPSSKPASNMILLVLACIIVLVPVLNSSVMPLVTEVKNTNVTDRSSSKGSYNSTQDTNTVSIVFLSFHLLQKSKCLDDKLREPQTSSESMSTLRVLLSPNPSILSPFYFNYISSKSFDHF